MIMGKVKGNWLTGAHSGRPCKRDDIYTKVNKKTGACYSVRLCHPHRERNEAQQRVMRGMGLLSKAVNEWVRREKAAQSKAYRTAEKLFNRQSHYATLRGMIMAKGMYKVSADGVVSIDINARTNFKEAFVNSSQSSQSSHILE